MVFGLCWGWLLSLFWRTLPWCVFCGFVSLHLLQVFVSLGSCRMNTDGGDLDCEPKREQSSADRLVLAVLGGFCFLPRLPLCFMSAAVAGL